MTRRWREGCGGRLCRQFVENRYNRAFARGKTGKPPCGRKKRSPLPASWDFPRKRWQNKAPRNNYLISGTKQSTGCCAPAQRGGKGTRFVGERQRPENRVTRFPPRQRWCRKAPKGEKPLRRPCIGSSSQPKLALSLPIKGPSFRLTDRTAGEVRRSRIGGSERSEPVGRMLIITYDTESQSRNADFISIARREIHNPRPEGPSNLRTLRPQAGQS